MVSGFIAISLLRSHHDFGYAEVKSALASRTCNDFASRQALEHDGVRMLFLDDQALAIGARLYRPDAT